jgi:hypothetical protein
VTPAPASRRDHLLDDSVAALRMVIAQLRELEGGGRPAVTETAGGTAARHSSAESADRH